jgi:hypothetical protein
VGHVETVLGDPAAELSTRPAVVGLHAQSPERIRDGGCACERRRSRSGRSAGRDGCVVDRMGGCRRRR